MRRRRLAQTTLLDQRLEEQAKRLRLEAKGTPHSQGTAGRDRRAYAAMAFVAGITTAKIILS